MARHFNPSITAWLRRIFNFKVGDFPSEDVVNGLTPVINVGPVAKTLAGAAKSTTGNLTVFTAHPDKDTFITGFNLVMHRDGTCDCTSIAVQTTQNGLAANLYQNEIITGAGSEQHVVVELNLPIKVDRGTAVTLTGTFAAGNLKRAITVFGYEQETTIAE